MPNLTSAAAICLPSFGSQAVQTDFDRDTSHPDLLDHFADEQQETDQHLLYRFAAGRDLGRKVIYV